MMLFVLLAVLVAETKLAEVNREEAGIFLEHGLPGTDCGLSHK